MNHTYNRLLTFAAALAVMAALTGCGKKDVNFGETLEAAKTAYKAPLDEDNTTYENRVEPSVNYIESENRLTMRFDNMDYNEMAEYMTGDEYIEERLQFLLWSYDRKYMLNFISCVNEELDIPDDEIFDVINDAQISSDDVIHDRMADKAIDFKATYHGIFVFYTQDDAGGGVLSYSNK